ncbi:MAG: bifunctional diaminohydroxyphosphoribosylaminopyrimidine deaminase/5-amino-6-(5-phosphoribosylamino)uracil reductase RibD [Muribaculum sp.]|nr:bifunctional diaminohydroxyphosphoribosylaminopyrimidine deaminase/5-amino-6-(5-phosphoribosylamino)uracil reductase RibD [Muribaculaceae bacterium]MCM1081675.1 bifunctional diaminohydroxyphosphoribosylaminopyrimidine deaminase/5-amino-6-(5-phosphoribosylamino)uracil reductase RibD [Muribaculum sp.]
MTTDEHYMSYAIELARHGLGYASPNPMVGCVIVCDGKIIGRGWHRHWGEGHAEVNAVASVPPEKQNLLQRATAYVTLEPCSHYGKTPPCARLLIDKGLKRVVVGSADPFDKVSGRGTQMLREAGIDVTVGVLESECRNINPTFMLAHKFKRPWITLKWAQSADCYIDSLRSPDEQAVRFSTQQTTMLVHRLRSLHDAILVGSGTMIADNPQLNVRAWPGRSPKRFVADRSGRLLTERAEKFTVLGIEGGSPQQYARQLYQAGCTSVLIEGGAKLLQSFIDAGIYDTIRIETAPFSLSGGIKAPRFRGVPVSTEFIDGRRIDYFGSKPWYF